MPICTTTTKSPTHSVVALRKLYILNPHRYGDIVSRNLVISIHILHQPKCGNNVAKSDYFQTVKSATIHFVRIAYMFGISMSQKPKMLSTPFHMMNIQNNCWKSMRRTYGYLTRKLHKTHFVVINKLKTHFAQMKNDCHQSQLSAQILVLREQNK